ncbi:hypothetical protein DLAC_04786 [Tieghemostelium lacteum]|uniref:Leucine-rich repeat-containing protein (LRR) n=1 Tax=Tieghemostelium lacteum TaxID=361077 RepID=A0A151ZKF5_TIELA|nr:hypothetical protein DLAC_04786 [Tieghemostelium lacteum]|eukprot:KYQ94482.1 hypothetical protein DLAC_04786 [Tieghemostelium lacteum]
MSNIQIVGPICTSKKEKPPVETAVEELKELGEYLKSNQDLPEKDIKFKRGTVCKDGRLDLCKQNVGPLGAEYLGSVLKGNTKIRHLLMGDDSLGPEGAKQVANIINQSTSLETVYLGCNYFNEEGARHLSEALQKNENIKALWIKRNHLGLGGASQISDLLSMNTHLKTLDLITNQLGPESIELLKNGLLKNSNCTLTSIQLDSNPIGPQGCVHLVEILRHLKSTLEAISLENTGITDKGVEILCQPLSDNSSALKILDLRSNDLGYASALSLSTMLHSNTSLKEISLGHSFNTIVVGSKPNHMGDSGLGLMATALKHNKTIQYIDMTWNNTTGESASYLISILKSHNLNAYIHIDLKPLTSNDKSVLLDLRKKRKIDVQEKKDYVKTFIQPIISVYRVEKAPKNPKSLSINTPIKDQLSSVMDIKPHENISFRFNSLVNK